MRRLRLKPFIYIFLFSGILSYCIYNFWVDGSQKNLSIPKQQHFQKVIVAQKDINPFERIKDEYLSFKDWPREIMDDNYCLQKENLIDKIAQGFIAKGEPFLKKKVKETKEVSFFKLDNHQTALTLPADLLLGHSGLIRPGDHVDIFLTRKIKKIKNGIPFEEIQSELLIGNVQILACDGHLEIESGIGKPPQSLTLAVVKEDVPKILLARELGKISTILLPKKGNEEKSNLEKICFKEENLNFSVSKENKKQKEKKQKIKIVQGAKVDYYEFKN